MSEMSMSSTRPMTSKRPDRIRGDCGICLSANKELLACHHSRCVGPDGEPQRACVSCHQRYIENNAAQVPMCMWNQHPFGRAFVYRNFPRSWIKGPLAQKRSEHLAEDQAAMFPALQEKASIYRHLHHTMYENKRPFREILQDLCKTMKEKDELVRKMTRKIQCLIMEFDVAHDKSKPSPSELYSKMERILIGDRMTPNQAEVRDYKFKGTLRILELRTVEAELRESGDVVGADEVLRQINEPQLARNRIIAESCGRGEVLQVKEASKVVCQCPSDGCNGFIMNKDSIAKCEMCESEVCIKCHKKVNAEGRHECNPDDLVSIRMIYNSTKKCPWEGCGVPITKASGCDQMWCTHCKRGFYWSTLRKHVGQGIHNPHYFEFVRTQTNHRPADNNNDYDSDPEPEGECCRNDVRPFSWGRVLEKTIPEKAQYSNMLRMINEAIDRFRPNGANFLKTDYRPLFEVLNVQKVAGSISDEKYKQELVRLDRSAQFSRDVYEIVITFVGEIWNTMREWRRLAKTLSLYQPNFRVFTRTIYDGVVVDFKPPPDKDTPEIKKAKALFMQQLDEGMQTIRALRLEINDELRNTGIEYNRNYPQFDPAFKMIIDSVKSKPSAEDPSSSSKADFVSIYRGVP